MIDNINDQATGMRVCDPTRYRVDGGTSGHTDRGLAASSCSLCDLA